MVSKKSDFGSHKKKNDSSILDKFDSLEAVNLDFKYCPLILCSRCLKNRGRYETGHDAYEQQFFPAPPKLSHSKRAC